MARSAMLHAASGGNVAGGCHPPARQQIDWIFGTAGAGFSGYQVSARPQTAHISDHPIVIAQANIR
jgi:endonuclease/exonuclease/phosphatase family metal-dependent hydrolase